MRGIVSYGAYIPYYRLKKETIAQAYGKRGGNGAKAVAYCDEDSITMDTTFVDDLGADSLDVFQIIMALEEEFDIEIANEEAEKIVTVSDAVEQIKNALN